MYRIFLKWDFNPKVPCMQNFLAQLVNHGRVKIMTIVKDSKVLNKEADLFLDIFFTLLNAISFIFCNFFFISACTFDILTKYFKGITSRIIYVDYFSGEGVEM